MKGQRQTILNRIIAGREQAIADTIYAQQTLDINEAEASDPVAAVNALGLYQR